MVETAPRSYAEGDLLVLPSLHTSYRSLLNELLIAGRKVEFCWPRAARDLRSVHYDLHPAPFTAGSRGFRAPGVPKMILRARTRSRKWTVQDGPCKKGSIWREPT
jgi:hypothetical protein